MEQTENATDPETATDEPVSSLSPEPTLAEDDGDWQFASEVEEAAFWKGVTHGIRCGAKPPPTHLPAAFEPDVGRCGFDPGLTSAALTDAFMPVATDARGRSIRSDGFTPDRQITFLSALAACGVVIDACRATGISKDTAYALRNSVVGRAFALAWDAAILIARGRMSDELMSRGMNGCIDRIYRNGELVAERHRHDNRLAMAILARLDRHAAGLGEGAAVARTIAQDWDRFLGIVGEGGEETDTFLAERAKHEAAPDAAQQIESVASMLSRLKTLELHRAGLVDRIRITDLDPAGMRRWSDEQWLRAELSGFLDRIPEEDWPDYARNEFEATSPGARRSRQVYESRFPEWLPSGDGDIHIWEDKELECWVTDFPPPEGFEGFENGKWGDDFYKRALSSDEQEILDDDLAAERAKQEAERAEALADAEEARDRVFGLRKSDA